MLPCFRAVLHCRSIGSSGLVGIGAIVLEGREVSPGCIITPGAVVPPDTQVEAISVFMGVPAELVRQATLEDFARIEKAVETYVQLGARHSAREFPKRRGRVLKIGGDRAGSAALCASWLCD